MTSLPLRARQGRAARDLEIPGRPARFRRCGGTLIVSSADQKPAPPNWIWAYRQEAMAQMKPMTKAPGQIVPVLR